VATGTFVFVNQHAKHLPENVGLAIVVICYINVFAMIISGVIFATIYILKVLHLV
jgi:hypothetical protein